MARAPWSVAFTAVFAGVAAACAAAGMPAPGPATAADAVAVASVVDRFHTALAQGDSAAVLALLQPHVRILEAGGVETLTEYREGHLAGDIAFARAVPSARSAPDVEVRGDVAWAVSTSTTRGQYGDRQINSAGAELMVLERTSAGWRIAAIHWSSRTLRQ
jgi:ketosteroid isomerase-like protein